MTFTANRTKLPAISPERVIDIGFGFTSSKVLITAVAKGLFTKLSGNPMTGKEITDFYGWKSGRGIYDFLDVLVALKTLEKVIPSTGGEAAYRTSGEADIYLNEKSEFYIGGWLTFAEKRLYRFWDTLGEALETGKPQSEVKYLEKSFFEELYNDQAQLRVFCEAMTGVSRYNFLRLVELYPFGRHKVHLDIGSSMGLLCKLIVENHPTVKSIAFDLPVVVPITRDSLQGWNVADRVEIVAGDMFEGDLPKADVVTLGNILHDWNLEDKKRILESIFKMLSKGGTVVIIENLIDDARAKNLFGLLMSLNMLVEFGNAYDTTISELIGICRQIGFTEFECLSVHGACSALIARK